MRRPYGPNPVSAAVLGCVEGGLGCHPIIPCVTPSIAVGSGNGPKGTDREVGPLPRDRDIPSEEPRWQLEAQGTRRV